MRILMLSWEYPPVLVGGLGRHVHDLATALVTAGHDVTVVTRHTGTAPRDEMRDGVRVVAVPEDPPLLPFATELLAWTMAINHTLTRAALAVVAESAYDVVHAHDWLVAHAATTIKHHLGVPMVATLHATEAGRHQGWLPEEMNRAIHTVEWWLTYEARRVLACSSYMRWEVTRLFDLPPEKVDVVPNAVDADRWSPARRDVTRARRRWAGDGPLLVTAGRLVYEKGIQDVLSAVPRLRRRHAGVRLVVAGAGPLQETLMAQAKRLRLGRSVVFAGFLDEGALAALVAAADVCVVPSVYEPFGLVALEAQAAGTPVAAADTGGLREVVPVAPQRFPAGDPAGLVAVVDGLLADQVGAARIARAARARVRSEHSWSGVAARTVTTYRQAIREERALHQAAPPLRLVVRDGNLLTGEV